MSQSGLNLQQMLAALQMGPRAPTVPGLIPPAQGTQRPTLQAQEILALLAQPRMQPKVR